MSGYAAGTAVPLDRSKAEIERMLRRYGCNQFGSGWAQGEKGVSYAHVTFKHGSTSIMLALPMPNYNELAKDGRGHRRNKTELDNAYAQEERRRWRALCLIIKAKLEAVSTGISTLEREFFSDLVLPDGSTLGDRLIPQLEAIQNGRLALPAHAEA